MTSKVEALRSKLSRLSTETPLGVVYALRSVGYVVDVGQFRPETRRMLSRLAKNGDLAPSTYLGFPIPKKSWVAVKAISYRAAA